MTVTTDYAETARRAQDVWTTAATTAADTWIKRLATPDLSARGRYPFTPADVTASVELWLDFARQLGAANLEYAKNLADVANAFTGAVRQHVDSVGEVVRGQVQAVTDTTVEQVDRVAHAVAEEAEATDEAVDEAAKEEARQARAAERKQAREARQAARERYEDKTKAQLQEELAKRDLPKTGNVDELIERLVDADVS